MYVFKLLFDSALLSVVAASTLWNTAGSKWLSPFQILTQTLVYRSWNFFLWIPVHTADCLTGKIPQNGRFSQSIYKSS